MKQSFREECGVIGVFGDKEAAKLAYLGLFAQQHRGQEGCGIVTLDHCSDSGENTKFRAHKSFGLVADSFTQKTLQELTGEFAIGHVRYSTQGGHIIQNVQPFYFKSALGSLAIAHNGNLTNAESLRKELEDSGSIFQSTSDTEVFVHLIARADARTVRDRIFSSMLRVQGAYSIVLMSEEALFAFRDPYGFRPLVLGKKNDAYIVASETCALDLIDAEFVREIQPGEVVQITKDGLESFYPVAKKTTAFCSFEPIYFARPDSQIFGDVIYTLRKKMGTILAREAPAPDAEVVIAVPDSGVPMAMGYAEQAKIPLELGLVRNHYVGRTFIQPEQEIRDFAVRLKLNPVLSVLKGKSVVVVDDSIVRGTTSAKIIRMIRQAGARNIHLRVGSPPITHSCFYGVDTPHREKLLAAQKNVDQIREFLGCDSIGYLSNEGLREALGDQKQTRFCTACFTGRYLEQIHATIVSQPTDQTGPGLRSGI